MSLTCVAVSPASAPSCKPCSNKIPSRATLEKKQTQIPESVDRDARCAQGHSSADTGVDHPVWQYRHNAKCYFDMDNPGARTLFAVLHPQSLTVKRVPTIVNLNFLPDMGRMDAALRWDARTTCSRGRMQVGSERRRSIVCWDRRS